MRDRRWDRGVKVTVREYYHLRDADRTEPQERRYRAVQDAIDAVGQYEDGGARLHLLRLLYWPGTHTIEGAALMVPCSVRTAKRWNRVFLSLVERNLNLP